MSDKQEIEKRLAEVEKEVADLKQLLISAGDDKSWIERITGTFKDDPDFYEIVRLGREFRKSVQWPGSSNVFARH